jgi:hypothetical protein
VWGGVCTSSVIANVVSAFLRFNLCASHSLVLACAALPDIDDFGLFVAPLDNLIEKDTERALEIVDAGVRELCCCRRVQ